MILRLQTIPSIVYLRWIKYGHEFDKFSIFSLLLLFSALNARMSYSDSLVIRAISRRGGSKFNDNRIFKFVY